MPTALDLYAGKGWKERKEKLNRMGWTVTTLDNDASFGCDYTVDILSVSNLRDLGSFDFVWASPPCERWSVTQIGRNWIKGTNLPKTKEAEFAIVMMQHTLSLLDEWGGKWALENPMGKLRKMEFMQKYIRHDISYCQYGDFRMKPTDIWTNGFEWKHKPRCKNGDPCHVAAPRGSQTGTQGMGSYADKSVVPLALWTEILDAVSGRAWGQYLFQV